MTGNVLPTLSTSGWVTAISEKADRLLSYFFEADGLQSSLYHNKVYSLPMIIKDFNGDANAITQNVETKLSDLFRPYFDAISVQSDYSISSSGEITIKIYAKITENGNEYSLGKLVVLADNNISKVLNLNN